MNEKNKKVIISVIVLLLVLIVIGITYAAFSYSKVGTTENAVTTGAVTMTYTEGDNGITINNAMPTSDEIGKKLNNEDQIFDFTVSMNIIGKFKIAYEVVAEKDTEKSTLGNQEVKLYLERSTDSTNYTSVMEPTYYVPSKKETSFGAPVGSMIMDTGIVTETTVYYYRLRMWVDEEYSVTEVAKKFTVRVNVYGTTEERSLDEEGPRCTFGEIEEKEVGEENSLILTCIDEEMGVEKKELQISDFTINDPELGEVKQVSQPTRITNGYQYEITLVGKKAGGFTLTLPEGVIKDKSGNKNQEVSKDIPVKGLPNEELSNLDITANVENIVYDGTAKIPTVVVKHGEVTLTEGVDYTIEYTDNTNAGEGTIKIIGTGTVNETTGVGYTGEQTKTFTIEKAEPVVTLSATSGSVGTKGGSFTESASIAGSFTHISSNTSIATVFPASYSDVAANTNKTVTITAKGNGTSTITVKFTPTDIQNYKSVTKTYTVTSDDTAPVWNLTSVTTSNGSTTATLADTIEIKVKATDDDSLYAPSVKELVKFAENGEFKFFIGGVEVKPALIATNYDEDKYIYTQQYTITFDLDGMVTVGDLTVILAEGLAQDRAGNTSVQTSIATGITISKVSTVGNYVEAYTYNEEWEASNYCISGLEPTCQKTTCYRTKTAGSCPAGTIIKYKVNNTTTLNFHVVEDKGNTMVMQSQKNLRYYDDYKIEWISKEDYIQAGGLESDWGNYLNTSKGPITALKALETATSDWTNVNSQTYAMGTTVFVDNPYTECRMNFSLQQDECFDNRYVLPNRVSKARMLTIQETVAVGCKNGSSCPVWLLNYVSTVNGWNYVKTINKGYWFASTSSTTGAYSSQRNSIYQFSYPSDLFGLRPVVVVSK